MNKFQDYDDSYKLALQSKDPIDFIEKRWGSPMPYYKEFLSPLVKKKMNVIEIGSGFGRYSKLILPYCRFLYAIEPSKLCRIFLTKNFTKIKALSPNELDNIKDEIDLIFSFSTFLHFNLYEIWFYLKALSPKLKKNGNMILHYMSFESNGFKLFKKSKIKNFGEVGRYFFHSPSQIKKLAKDFHMISTNDKTPEIQLVPGHRVITLRKIK